MSAADRGSPSRRTLLIGSETLLGAWSAHASNASHVIAVSHTDLARALALIDQAQPEVVVVEQSLVSTEPGLLLMEHLHSERSLRGLEISLLPAVSVDTLLSTSPGDADPQQWLTGLSRPLPPRPVRSAVRVPGSRQEKLSVDGRPATLLDVSVTGAQIESPGALRPNQHVRIALGADRGSAKAEGVVVWSSLQAGPPLHYRAGIEFKTKIPSVLPEPAASGGTGSPPPKKPRKASSRTPRKPRKQ